MRAVIYCRFSSSRQREASIEDQERCCREFCAREGHDVVRVYADRAMSGRTDDRPEFQRMIANAGESDLVVVYMMDRFSRDPYDAPVYKRELSKRGVRVVSATESISDTPEGIVMEKLLEGMAAAESMRTSRRTVRGMEGEAMKAHALGVRVYGYGIAEDGTYVVEPSEAEIVREVFRRHNNGEPTNAIARDLAARGVTTYAGNPCGYTMVYNILRNRKYTGEYRWGGIVIDGGMPQIVSVGEFEMAQSIRPRKLGSRASYVLSGKALCGTCAMDMQGASGTGRGRSYSYYRCRDGHVKPIRVDYLHSEIVKRVRELLSDRETALSIAAGVIEATGMDEDAGERRKAAQRRLREAEEGLSNLMSAVEKGMPYELVEERVSQLGEMRERARLEADVVEATPEDFADFLQFGANLDDSSLLEAFVYQVVVSDGDVLVTLNCDIGGEPARFRLVRVDCDWLPVGNGVRIRVLGGRVVIGFDRVA